MSECNHDCGSCSANCDSRKADKSEFLEALNPASSVKKVIGVVSGKGGVGKSMVTASLANQKAKRGLQGWYPRCRYHRTVHPENVWPERTCKRR